MSLASSLGKSMNRRFCFLCDEDTHWYLVSVEKAELFEKLLYKDSDVSEERFEEEFGDCRLAMHISNYSFMLPSEI